MPFISRHIHGSMFRAALAASDSAPNEFPLERSTLSSSLTCQGATVSTIRQDCPCLAVTKPCQTVSIRSFQPFCLHVTFLTRSATKGRCHETLAEDSRIRHCPGRPGRTRSDGRRPCGRARRSRLRPQHALLGLTVLWCRPEPDDPPAMLASLPRIEQDELIALIAAAADRRPEQDTISPP